MFLFSFGHSRWICIIAQHLKELYGFYPRGFALRIWFSLSSLHCLGGLHILASFWGSIWEVLAVLAVVLFRFVCTILCLISIWGDSFFSSFTFWTKLAHLFLGGFCSAEPSIKWNGQLSFSTNPVSLSFVHVNGCNMFFALAFLCCCKTAVGFHLQDFAHV